jgi:ferritin-like metal-binding protein YciE
MEYYRETYITNQKDIYQLEEQILEASDMIGYFINNDSLTSENSSPKTGNIRIRREKLNAYLNLLARQLIVTKIDKENYRKVAVMSRDLINNIKQEYDLK